MNKKTSTRVEKSWQWVEQAACKHIDPEKFFPQGSTVSQIAVRACEICPVKPQCHMLAQEIQQQYGTVIGIFAGKRYHSKGTVETL